MRRDRTLVNAGLVVAGAIVSGWWLAQPREVVEHIQVMAASSLTEAFEEMAIAFEEEHGTEVALGFAGSQILRLQIEHGGQFDVFASADLGHVQQLVNSGLAVEPAIFAHNRLAVIRPSRGPSRVDSFEELALAERLIIAMETVPLGRYTREMLTLASDEIGEEFTARVLAGTVSQANNARSVRASVELGEADAAIVYLTDAQASDRVRTIPIPEHLNPRADYATTLLTGARNPEAARAWLDFVRGPDGRRILERHGFEVPE